MKVYQDNRIDAGTGEDRRTDVEPTRDASSVDMSDDINTRILGLRQDALATRAERERQEAAEREWRDRFDRHAAWSLLEAGGFEARPGVKAPGLTQAVADLVGRRVSGLLLYGPTGLGKSMIGQIMARADGWTAESAPKLVDRWNKTHFELREWPGLRGVRGLVIDDLAAEPEGNNYGSPRNVWADLIQLHFEDWRGHPPIIVTANIPPDADNRDVFTLRQQYGARAWSRLLQHLRPIRFSGPDQRPSIHGR